MIVRTMNGTFRTGRSGSTLTRVKSDGDGGYVKHPSENRQTSEKQQSGNKWAEENSKSVGNKKD